MCKNCQLIHDLFGKLPRFEFPFDENKLPLNGIYILFEKGESAHGGDRIVRIGTHTGDNNLKSRLKEHFINENKDRSIFRKNIGRCLLKGDPFIKDWELVSIIRKVKEENPNIDFEKQAKIEQDVTKTIRGQFSFSVVPIKDKKDRLKIESKIISTVSLCKDCSPSKTWLGLSSPRDKIIKSGLWLVNELWKTPLSNDDIKKIERLLN